MFDVTRAFGHDVPYPRECVDRLIELISTGQLRIEWKESISCLLMLAAFLASRIANRDPDGPLVFGSGPDDIPSDLPLLAMQLDDTPLPVGGIKDVLLQAILRRILVQLVELLASNHEEVANWIADQLAKL